MPFRRSDDPDPIPRALLWMFLVATLVLCGQVAFALWVLLC